MLPITPPAARASFNAGMRGVWHSTFPVNFLTFVARPRLDAPVECRSEREIRHLQQVLDTPHRSLTLSQLLDTGMPPEAAAHLHSALRDCADGELCRRIHATPTLHDWAASASWQLPTVQRNDDLQLSLRVLQLFGHTTGVPVIYDARTRDVTFSYVAGITPLGPVPTGGDYLEVLLRKAASPCPSHDVDHVVACNALALLLTCNDIDGRANRWPHWQRELDRWRHGSDEVRTVQAKLTPTLQTWLEAHRDRAVAPSVACLLQQGKR